jgi:hypothetical protein
MAGVERIRGGAAPACTGPAIECSPATRRKRGAPDHRRPPTGVRQEGVVSRIRRSRTTPAAEPIGALDRHRPRRHDSNVPGRRPRRPPVRPDATDGMLRSGRRRTALSPADSLGVKPRHGDDAISPGAPSRAFRPGAPSRAFRSGAPSPGIPEHPGAVPMTSARVPAAPGDRDARRSPGRAERVRKCAPRPPDRRSENSSVPRFPSGVGMV